MRTTRDGHVVLIHDASVDRTTSGSGPVDAVTWAQIRSLRVERADGTATAGLPTFVRRSLRADALFASEFFFLPRAGFAETRDAGAEMKVYLWRRRARVTLPPRADRSPVVERTVQVPSTWNRLARPSLRSSAL